MSYASKSFVPVDAVALPLDVPSRTCSADAMAPAISSCTAKTSCARRSNVSCQMTRPSAALVSSAVTRTRSPARRTVPLSTELTSSAFPTSGALAFWPLKRAAEFRPASRSPGTRASAVVSSSAMPSEKYVLAASPPTEAKE
jgi:hypothetical protein